MICRSVTLLALVSVTVYPGVERDSRDAAHAEEELPRWLLAQRRRRP